MAEIDINDHTLVWATHRGVELAAQVPRSFLHPSVSDGWTEVSEGAAKVHAAQEAAPPVTPVPNEPGVSNPTGPRAAKEK